MRRALPVLSARLTSGFAQCKGCGKCCKSMPGMYVPADFGGKVHRMADAIRRGVAQVDKWDDEGDALGEVYFLRAPTASALGSVFQFSWGNDPCALLRPYGCALTYNDRPRVCRGLVPNRDGTICREKGMSKRDFVERWKRFSARLLKLATLIDRETA